MEKGLWNNSLEQRLPIVCEATGSRTKENKCHRGRKPNCSCQGGDGRRNGILIPLPILWQTPWPKQEEEERVGFFVFHSSGYSPSFQGSQGRKSAAGHTTHPQPERREMMGGHCLLARFSSDGLLAYSTIPGPFRETGMCTSRVGFLPQLAIKAILKDMS